MSLSIRAYLVVGAIVLLGIAGQWWGGAVYNLWRFPAAMLILAIVIEGLSIRRQGFLLERQVDTHLALGQGISGSMWVHNPERLTLYLETQPQYPAELVGEEAVVRWTVGASSSVHKEFQITPVRLGATSLGPVYGRVLGRLGLGWWSRKLSTNQELQVIPRALNHRESGSGSVEGGAKPFSRISSSGTELLSLREYQPGDPLHSIDWKATARSRRPTVRVFGQEQHMELVLVLDAGRSSQLQANSLSYLHHYVNVAARLAELAIRQGDWVGLVSFADRPLDTVAVGKGMSCLRAIRAHLQALRSQSRESNPLAAVLLLRRLLRHRGLVVFLTTIEEKEAAIQLVKAVSLLVPKHTPLIASLVDEHIDSLQHRLAQHWLDPYLSYAALEYTRSVRHTVMDLQRLGGEVVLAKPDRLDAAVLQHYRRLRERRRV